MGSSAAGVLLFALCVCVQAAQPLQPEAHSTKTSICNCAAPAPAQPVEPDARGTDQSPLAVKVTQLPPAAPPAEPPRDWSGRVIAGATVVLALVTAALAIFTYRLWRSTGELVEENRKTAVRQLRAYVFVQSHVLAPMFVDQPTKATLIVKNYGRTPARNLRISGGQYVANVFPPGGVPNTPALPAGTLGPGATYQFTTNLRDPLTNQYVEGMRTGALTLFVFGTLYYEDAFHRERFTNFRLMSGGSIHGAEWNQLYSAPQGNEPEEPD